jgi:hypothetical protein
MLRTSSLKCLEMLECSPPPNCLSNACIIHQTLFDGRYNSRDFARTAARVLMSRGVKVHLFSDLIPTPLVAFGVAHLNAAAGVCVTVGRYR